MILIFLILLLVQTNSQLCQPYGVRLFFGHYFSYLRNSQDVIRVVFNTEKQCKDQFSLNISNDESNQTSQLSYYESELLNMTQIYENNATTHFTYETWVHTFKIGIRNINISLSQEYNYTIVNKQNEAITKQYTFDVPLARGDQKMLVFGDMDSNWVLNYSKPTFDWLENEVKQNKRYDTILFTGDMAYDLESHNCQQGDYWLRNISVFASRYPFMAAPGNHDWGNNSKFDFFRANFGNLYLKEFNTDKYLNDFTSFDVGYVHFIHFNPIKVVYKNDIDNITPLIVELMRNDLILANQNREQVPWIIVYVHYPIYCNTKNDQCLNNYKYLSAFEDLFVEFKVDLYLSGHQHNYQRNKPYYQNKEAQFKQRDNNVIYNYNYPVSIIEGVGGTDYGEQNQTFDPSPFMEFQNPDHGVGIITIKNKTYLYYEHITVSDNKVIDSVWIDRQVVSFVEDSKTFELVMWILFAVLVLVAVASLSYKQKFSHKKKKISHGDVTLITTEQ